MPCQARLLLTLHTLFNSQASRTNNLPSIFPEPCIVPVSSRMRHFSFSNVIIVSLVISALTEKRIFAKALSRYFLCRMLQLVYDLPINNFLKGEFVIMLHTLFVIEHVLRRPVKHLSQCTTANLFWCPDVGADPAKNLGGAWIEGLNFRPRQTIGIMLSKTAVYGNDTKI